MVGIAQLVERLVVVQEVAGSSPVTHPNEPEGHVDDVPFGVSATVYPPSVRAPVQHEDAAVGRQVAAFVVGLHIGVDDGDDAPVQLRHILR